MKSLEKIFWHKLKQKRIMAGSIAIYQKKKKKKKKKKRRIISGSTDNNNAFLISKFK